MQPVIYLDYAASTPCHKEVVDAMTPFFSLYFSNPSSINHRPGKEVNDAVQGCRSVIAACLGAFTEEIIFTSGATEANNLAIKGASHCYKEVKRNFVRNHIITSVQEHKSVLECFHEQEENGLDVTYLENDQDGRITADALLNAITDRTFFVSVMWVNNETGVINDIERIAQVCKNRDILFHTDATQAYGKTVVNVGEVPIDLLSISSHKIHGPKGVGALIVKSSVQKRLVPLILGGGQEKNLRSGTVNAAGIIGFGKASEMAERDLPQASARISEIRQYFERRILSEIEQTHVNCIMAERAPHISSISFTVKEGIALLKKIDQIACSSGSACDSADNRLSHVLLSLGLTPHQAKNTLRFSFGQYTTLSEVDRAILHLKSALTGI